MEPVRPIYRDPRGYLLRMGPVFWGLHRQASRRACKAIPPGGSLLDVGCGPGTLMRIAARRRADIRIEGVDPSGEMVRYGLQRTPGRLQDRMGFTEAGAEQLPFPDAMFDSVVSTMSFQHWFPVERAVSELLRVTKPSGRVFLYNIRGAAYGPLRTAASRNPGWSGETRTVRMVSRPLLLFTHVELARA